MYDSGAGFDYFGPAHLGYLACSVVLIGVLCAAYRRLPSGTAWGSPRRTMQLVIAAIPLAMLASRDVMMYLAGVFDPNWWPLHSCNICELLMLVYALKPNRLCGESLATMGIFGALAALLFPSWSYCPPFTWPSVCGFTEHTLIVAFTAMVITGRDYEPSVKHIWMPLVLFGLYVPAAYAFNKAFDTNFMFLNAPPGGSPLVAVAELFVGALCVVARVVASRRARRQPRLHARGLRERQRPAKRHNSRRRLTQTVPGDSIPYVEEENPLSETRRGRRDRLLLLQ